MNKYFCRLLVLLPLVVLAGSCRKSYPSQYPPAVEIERKFSFQLYTSQDFSTDNAVIKFSLFIKNTHTTFFDTTLASMHVKDIPDALHKLVFEKTVLTNENVDLAAGFRYEIENVGTSSHIDTSKAGNTFKVVDFDFQ